MGSSAIRSSPRVDVPLRQAADRLLEDLPAELRQLAPDFVGAQVEWVLASSDGRQPDEDPVAPATLVVRRLLIDALGSQLLAAWNGAAEEAPEVVRALQRLELAREAGRPHDERAFAAELADQAGLNLVVEVAHDMRSPLTSILFLSELLHKGQSGPMTDVQKHQIGIIYSAALGLENIASDMIEAARGGQRLSQANAVPFSVNDIMSAVLGLVRPMAEEKGLAVVVQPLRAAFRVGQPIPLSRVILNLCTNALKFTHDGKVEIAARSLGGNAVEFSVQDTGHGIAPEALSTLFQPFRREPGRATGYVFSGTGLGLAICRRLVTAMNSELQLETDPVSGTRFWFVLDLPPAEFL
jgi:signal transduction histidine kinase